MGVTFRKSVSVGPLRFNLSQSGIGMSAGVKGLRVGTGPRGGYVRGGRGGFQYHQTLGRPRPPATGTAAQPPAPAEAVGETARNLEGPDVEAFVAASRGDIVRRISEAASLRRPAWISNPFSYRRRKMDWIAAAAVPLFYELDTELEQIYGLVVAAAEMLAASPGKYYDSHHAALAQQQGLKGHGGADSLVDRQELRVGCWSPPAVTLNFEPVAFASASRTIYFLPDQILLHQGTNYAALSYSDLQLHRHTTQFITTRVPPGVTPISHTWQYVNKSGGPDRRYSNNPQLPIISAHELDFHGPSGFQFHTAFTDPQAVDAFVTAWDGLADAAPPT